MRRFKIQHEHAMLSALELELCKYSQSSRKRPPREFKKVAIITCRAGRLRDWAVISDHALKQ